MVGKRAFAFQSTRRGACPTPFDERNLVLDERIKEGVLKLVSIRFPAASVLGCVVKIMKIDYLHLRHIGDKVLGVEGAVARS